MVSFEADDEKDEGAFEKNPGQERQEQGQKDRGIENKPERQSAPDRYDRIALGCWSPLQREIKGRKQNSPPPSRTLIPRQL